MKYRVDDNEYRVSANLLPPPGAAPRRVITPN
jgi:hypothetical protein